MKIVLLVGTRPNYIKAFPVYKQLITNHQVIIIHSGQHFDVEMDKIFFDDLNIKSPDYNLQIRGSMMEQISSIYLKLPSVLNTIKPDLVFVFGDVSTTFAGAYITKQLGFKLAHVESGLRSRDISMPEEINRIIVDHLSDYLFVTERSGMTNLKNEGLHNAIFVGNTMIDTLIDNIDKIKINMTHQEYNLTDFDYIVLTLHRPPNVDSNKIFDILNFLDDIGISIIYPVHPRIKDKLFNKYKNIKLIKPLGYINFLGLVSNCHLVITDSGGIQEETSFLGIPCLTFRQNTERPVTIYKGTNKLIDFNEENKTKIKDYILDCSHNANKHNIEGYDGHASKRIAEYINKLN